MKFISVLVGGDGTELIGWYRVQKRKLEEPSPSPEYVSS